ncbi:nucleotidyltransferase domain-containing protein [Luedemannella helvata]|uniref:Nucleotidyltransferase domain-containing protein n=1 Tax=Luedemannella helvata TaxID=349315 RepID=A0ABN2L0R9_9ACTN
MTWRPGDDPRELVRAHTAYSCVVGSRAYGLDGPDSDYDRRGVFVVPTPAFWGLDDPPTHIDGPAEEQFSWELRRFCELALTGNPTVLECLWSPLVEHVDDAGRELLALRGAFLSARLEKTYGEYARDQFARLTAVRQRTGEIRWKQAMHMIRLLLAGAYALRHGEILVDVSAYRDRLLAVRAGDVAWDEVTAWAEHLRAELVAAARRTALPVEPDRAAVADFLVRTRRARL